MNWLLVFVGGGLGSVLRFAINKLVNFLFPTLVFPVATLVANVLSCLLFASGVLLFFPKLKHPEPMQFFLLTGICGGLSTFSTFSSETFLLLKAGHYGFAIANIIMSVLCCVGVFWWLLRR